ncbi:hypothetical protein [Leptolyngbya sp. FACHB-17]|nr:hypothetical protein [Leptolyngbya sp. FACHB-17]
MSTPKSSQDSSAIVLKSSQPENSSWVRHLRNGVAIVLTHH